MDRALGRAGLEQGAPVLARGRSSPRRRRPRGGAPPRRARAGSRGSLPDRGAGRAGRCRPVAVSAPATRVMSWKLGPTCRRASPCSDSRPPPVSEHVREHVRQVAETRPRAGRGSRRRPRPARRRDRDESRWRRSNSRPPDCSVRRQVPGGAVEQVGARVRHAGGLGPGDRVAADEARVRRCGPTRSALRRADVGDDACPRRARPARPAEFGSAPTGAQANTARRRRPPPRPRSRRGDRPDLPAREPLGSRPKPHLGGRDGSFAAGRATRRSARRRGRRRAPAAIVADRPACRPAPRRPRARAGTPPKSSAGSACGPSQIASRDPGAPRR